MATTKMKGHQKTSEKAELREKNTLVGKEKLEITCAKFYFQEKESVQNPNKKGKRTTMQFYSD